MRFMTKKSLFAVSALALIAAGSLLDFKAQAQGNGGLSDVQKSEVRQVIKDYLRENPDMIVESLRAAQEKQQRDSLAAAQKKIGEYKDAMTAPGLPGAGNPNGDVTVVEFFDYNCGYCKKAVEDIKEILNTDKNVRFVFFEMPILSPTSTLAAQWALAAHMQGKYFEFHTALMEHRGGIDEATLEDFAKQIGLDVVRMKQDAASQKIASEIENGKKMGMGMGISGTPGFIINGQPFPGYLGPEGMKSAIRETREGSKSE